MLGCFTRGANGLVFAFFFVMLASGFAAEEAEDSPSPAKVGEEGAATNNPSDEVLRAYLQKQERANLILQEKLQSLQMNMEQTRQEAEATARHSADALATRLKLIEQVLSDQRREEIEATKASNRFMLLVAGVFGAIGLIAMVFTAWFLLRAMNRLAEVAAAFPPGFPERGIPLGEGERPLRALPPESDRLLGALDRLEQRIHELEQTSHVTHSNGDQEHGTSGHTVDLLLTEGNEGAEGPDRISVLLKKGESLLNLDQPGKALACFDELLALKPGNAEALVKKGSALERLKRWDEALKCYDEAIANDNSMTLAYLYKGGVFNQLERFSEALECYEQALRTQQKTPA